MPFDETNNLRAAVRQSPPVDTAAPYDTASMAGKTILITGGASGFGASFARRWASLGAHIAIGDIDDAAGEALVAELRATTAGGDYHHYQHCDVTSWASQVALFRAAVEHSATGEIHAVVPNAGVADADSPANGRGFENPAANAANAASAAGPDPLPPRLAVVDVNVTGVLYSVHLAMHWLPRNTPGSPGGDRHILLVSSIAGLVSLPGQALYTASKHAVTGLFRALRGTSYLQGVRVNMLCPYFVDTGILPTAGVLLLAGGGKGKIEDVVEAGTRLMADKAIAGHGLVIGPKMRVKRVDPGPSADGRVGIDLISDPRVDLLGLDDQGALAGQEGQAVWECYAHDYDMSEVFVSRFVRLINLLTLLRGWKGVLADVLGIFWSGREPAGRPKKK